MRLLLDTHLLLWAVAQPERLPPRLRTTLEAPTTTVLFSAASIWELAIKIQLGRFTPQVTAAEIAEEARRTGFDELPISAAHAARVEQLPLHHRDPFDRLLVAQAMHEPARLVTVDRVLLGYSELVDVVAAASPATEDRSG